MDSTSYEHSAQLSVELSPCRRKRSEVQHRRSRTSHMKKRTLLGALDFQSCFAPSIDVCPRKSAEYTDRDEYLSEEHHFQMKRSTTEGKSCTY
jgi:hypothetical protein